MILVFTLFACSLAPDLPEGWEDAERVADFSQAECHDEGERALSAETDPGGVALAVDHIGARCAQDLEAWWQPAGDDAAEVLIQPVDMTPDYVAKCGCTYDVAMVVPTEVAIALDVYQRHDRYGGDDAEPEMSLLGTAALAQ